MPLTHKSKPFTFKMSGLQPPPFLQEKKKKKINTLLYSTLEEQDLIIAMQFKNNKHYIQYMIGIMSTSMKKKFSSPIKVKNYLPCTSSVDVVLDSTNS